MATMAEVAARAGVSTATVSRTFNGKPVKPEHAEAVRRAAAELDYAMDRTARSLRRRHSDVLALVVPDVENPFFTAIARGVEDCARQAGLSLVLCNSDDDPSREARYIEIAAEEGMAGIILAPASPSPRLDLMAKRQRTVVVIDRLVPDEVDQIVFDNVVLGREATQRLLDRSAQRIACITGPTRIATATERATGWRTAHAEAGLAVDPDLLRHANFRVDGGREAMEALLSSPHPPDAVLATNNMVGIGVLQVLSQLRPRRRVHVSVIGDLPYLATDVSDVVLLPLRPRELGMRAARMFLERLDGLTGPARRVVLDPSAPAGTEPAEARASSLTG